MTCVVSPSFFALLCSPFLLDKALPGNELLFARGVFWKWRDKQFKTTRKKRLSITKSSVASLSLLSLFSLCVSLSHTKRVRATLQSVSAQEEKALIIKIKIGGEKKRATLSLFSSSFL